MNYVLLSSRPWNRKVFDRLSKRKGEKWYYIDKASDFTPEQLKEIAPSKIFIPHWSDIIPESIYSRYECIVFHMTDLPFGRGGSPLQNLIVRGLKETKLSALRVIKDLDAGDIYLKKDLPLYGTAEEIFIRASAIMGDMVEDIIDNQLLPKPQQGEVVKFKRRKAEESNIALTEEIEQLYDFIRMLDAEGYPHAFLETENFRIEFTRASLKADNSIKADVRITKK